MDSIRINPKIEVSQRSHFIKKTYSHLFAAILGFVGIEAYLFQSGYAYPIAKAFLSVSWLLVLGAFMGVGWLAGHFAHSATSKKAQYGALIGYVVAEALIFVPLLYMAQSSVGSTVIGHAGIVTLLAFSGLTWLVMDSKKDFSFLEIFLKWGGICALVLIVVGVLFKFDLGLYFSVFMVCFAGAAILYDTSNIIHHFDDTRYVSASLQLFSSVALMFWYVLRIFMSRR